MGGGGPAKSRWTPPFLIHSVSPGHLHVAFPSRWCNFFPVLTWAGHSSPTRPGLCLSVVRGHTLLASDSGSLLPPPSLPGEAVLSATCLPAGHPSLPFSKSLMSTPTFCHAFLLTPRNRPRALPFLFPKHTLLTDTPRTRRGPLHNCSTSGFSSYFSPGTVSSSSYHMS